MSVVVKDDVRNLLLLIKEFALELQKNLDDKSGTNTNTSGLELIDEFSVLSQTNNTSRLLFPLLELDNDKYFKLGIMSGSLYLFNDKNRPVIFPVMTTSINENRETEEEEFIIDMISENCKTEKSFDQLKKIYTSLIYSELNPKKIHVDSKPLNN